MKHEITNDKNLDAIKDNFNPPMMSEIEESIVRELFFRLWLDFDGFFIWIKKEGEYLKDNGKIYFWTKDVANFIKKSNINNK